MNLNEAAEIAELDKTPISEDWLRENGWSGSGFGFFHKHGINLRRPVDANGKWVANSLWTNLPIQTLGELRTLLRLCGAREKENDA
jgi:hypothetical protein